MRAPRTLRASAFLTLITVVALVSAQGGVSVAALQKGATVYVEVGSLARAAGVVAHADGNVLTWRGAHGPVTLFGGSSEALAQPAGGGGPTVVALSAPVLTQGSEWYVPLDALAHLGVEVPAFADRPAHLQLHDGRTAPLDYRAADAPAAGPAPAPATSGRPSWESVEPPLTGVRFFDGQGVSLLLADLALVPLAEPSLTHEVDLAIDRARAAGSDHVLLLMVTAVANARWEPTLVFSQGGRRLEVSAPYRLLVEVGDAGSVGPEAPVMGAVLLPATFSLYRPLRVEWGGVAAEVLLRH